MSKIEWTEKSYNPVTGCTPVSPGCANCYARTMSKRLAGRYGYPADEPFRVTMHPDKLAKPLEWKKAKRIFVCSMGDLFHDDVPEAFIDHIFAIMAIAEQHTFQVLTKRPKRMRDYMKGRDWGDAANRMTNEFIRPLDGPLYLMNEIVPPLPNVWLGTTVEDQSQDHRIKALLEIDAAVLFVSLEPLLGPINMIGGSYGPNWLEGWDVEPVHRCQGDDDRCHHECPEAQQYQTRKIDWVICGGESGPGARPMHLDWARDIRDQCVGANVPFMFKQWGAWIPYEQANEVQKNGGYNSRTSLAGDGKSRDVGHWLKTGKKAAGRELDGRIWDEYPKARE